GRRSPVQRVDHQEEFHQVMVHRVAGRLHDKDVRAADVLFELHARLVVTPLGNDCPSEVDLERFADGPRQRWVRVAGKDLQPSVHRSCPLPYVSPAGLRDAIGRAGMPTTTDPAATSLVTTLPAPVLAPSATVTGATSTVSEPMNASCSTTVAFFCFPS